MLTEGVSKAQQCSESPPDSWSEPASLSPVPVSFTPASVYLHTHTHPTHRKGGLWRGEPLPRNTTDRFTHNPPPTFFLRLGHRHLRVSLLQKGVGPSPPPESKPLPSRVTEPFLRHT